MQELNIKELIKQLKTLNNDDWKVVLEYDPQINDFNFGGYGKTFITEKYNLYLISNKTESKVFEDIGGFKIYKDEKVNKNE